MPICSEQRLEFLKSLIGLERGHEVAWLLGYNYDPRALQSEWFIKETWEIGDLRVDFLKIVPPPFEIYKGFGARATKITRELNLIPPHGRGA